MKIRCPHCGQRLNAPEANVGKRAKCPKCSVAFIIPNPAPSNAPKQLASELRCEIKKSWLGKYQSKYTCPACDEQLTSDEGEIGQRIDCPTCGTPLVVPGRSQLAEIEWQKNREEAETRAKKEREIRLQEEARAEQQRREEARRREERRLQLDMTARPFDYPVAFTVNHDGIEYRDRYFEAKQDQLRVNPELDLSDGKLAIKSIRLFKKHVNMAKRENAQETRDTKAQFRASKPRVHKSRRKGLVAGFVNVGIEASRISHATELDNALLQLEARKELCDNLLLACDQLIHQVEIRMIEDTE